MSENHVNEPEVLKENLPEGESSENTENAENAPSAENENGSKAEKGRKNKKEKEKLTGWPRVIKEIREWAISLAVAVAAVFIISNFLLLPIRVDGASMNPTLTNGERLLVTVYDVKITNKLEKGDIVICNYPGRTNKDPILHLITMKTNFVKRIVGVPGDTVSRVNGVTYVNGEPLDIRNQQSYSRATYEKNEDGTLTYFLNGYKLETNENGEPVFFSNGHEVALSINDMEFDYEYVLGEEEYFVVGDNRYNSHDSRAWNGPDFELNLVNSVHGDVGPVTRDMIVGRAKFVFWPFKEAEKLETNPLYAYPGDPVPGRAQNSGGSDEISE